MEDDSVYEGHVAGLPTETRAALALSIADVVENSKDALIVTGLKAVFVELIESLVNVPASADNKSTH